MTDWVTISALATAGGTLVLAGWLRDCITERTIFAVELLYSDHEGSQRAIGLFALAPDGDGDQWICSVVRHWNLDRPNPR